MPESERNTALIGFNELWTQHVGNYATHGQYELEKRIAPMVGRLFLDVGDNRLFTCTCTGPIGASMAYHMIYDLGREKPSDVIPLKGIQKKAGYFSRVTNRN